MTCALGLALAVLLAACDGGTSSAVVRTRDRPPVCALAAPSAVPCGGARTRVLLDATGSFDPDDPSAPLAYRWRSDCPEAQWLFPSPGRAILELFGCDLTCTIDLTVTSGPLSTRCTVPVVVLPPSTFAQASPVPTNLAPVCDAGAMQVHECPGPVLFAALDGSASFDPEGAPLTYRWSTQTPGASFSDPTSPHPTLRLPTGPGCALVSEVRLTVDDGAARASCSTTIQVLPPNLPGPGSGDDDRPPALAPRGARAASGPAPLEALLLAELGALVLPAARPAPAPALGRLELVAAGELLPVRRALPWSAPLAAAWPAGLPPGGLLLFLEPQEARALDGARRAVLLARDEHGAATAAWPLRLASYSPSTSPSETRSTSSPSSR